MMPIERFPHKKVYNPWTPEACNIIYVETLRRYEADHANPMDSLTGSEDWRIQFRKQQRLRSKVQKIRISQIQRCTSTQNNL